MKQSCFETFNKNQIERTESFSPFSTKNGVSYSASSHKKTMDGSILQ